MLWQGGQDETGSWIIFSKSTFLYMFPQLFLIFSIPIFWNRFGLALRVESNTLRKKSTTAFQQYLLKSKTTVMCVMSL